MTFLSTLSTTVLVLVAALLIFRRARYRSMSGALFSARISQTVGSVDVVNTPRALRIKVHALGKSEPAWIGVELEQFDRRAPQIDPITLSRSEAIELSELLRSAAGHG